MGKPPKRKIYQQSEYLKSQIPRFPDMTRKERTLFLRAVRALIADAQQAEQEAWFKRTISRLQNIVATWEEFLNDIKRLPVRTLPVIRKIAKTSPELIEFKVEDAVHSYSPQRASYASQILRPGKVSPNSHVTFPLDPEVRAIFDEAYGIVDATGHTK